MTRSNTKGACDELWDKLEKDLAASPLVAGLRVLASAQNRLQSGRPLSDGERLRLESQGNTCTDWSRIRLGSDAGLENIRNNRLEGDVLISGFSGEWPGPAGAGGPVGRTWPAGMANCRIRDAVIGNACLYDITRLENQVIDDGAVLVGIGEIDCPAPTLFSLGRAIHPGTEASTRTVWMWDGMTLDDCVKAIALGAEAQRDLQARLDKVLSSLRCRFGYVGGGASVLHARHVHSAWIGPGSRIAGASLIREAALLSSEGEPCMVAEEGWVEHALLQPGAQVKSSGKVSSGLLLEHSEISWGGMVFQSVIGPNTQVAKGEISHSLIGPFVGFHHQSLLISALWPEGRGNIAYGANVGSNHTGKKPDQEIRPGEGVFFGLGCSIKFPANFEDSPYSIIAPGLITLPQRLAFPLSLINQPHSAFPEISPALNEITPAWMWSDNAYALVRRSYRLEDGNKARRHDFDDDPSSTLPRGFLTGPIFARAMARSVHKALSALKSAPPGKPYYLEEDIPGLGKNFLRGKNLAGAAKAYEDYLHFYLFLAYADRPLPARSQEIRDLIGAIAASLGVTGDATGDGARAHLAGQRHRVQQLRADIGASVARDDKRGRQIFDDYAEFHAPPEEDSSLARLDKDLAELERRLDKVLKA